MAGFEARIAWRYLRARRKQVVVSVVTAISVLGVTVGTAALVIALALLTGFQEEVRERILAANAHLLMFSGYVGRAWHGWEDPYDWARELPEVRSASALVLEKGLMVSDFSTTGVMLRGVDPEAGEGSAAVPGRLVQGRLSDLASHRRGIILGKDLANSLGVTLDADVQVITSRPTLTPFGPAPGARRFRVIGLFETGFFEYDSTWALLSRETAQELFGEPGAVSAVQIQVHNLDGVDDVAEALRATFPAEVDTLTWKEMNRPLFSAFKLEKLLMFISIGLIVIVGALNIGALLVMSVMEKTRDIGILRAMGAPASSVRRVFVLQGLVVGVIGTAVGCLLGFSLCWILDTWQIVRLDPQVYFIDHLPFRVRPLEFTAVASVAIFVSWLATLYPAWKAARLDPVQSLRYE